MLFEAVARARRAGTWACVVALLVTVALSFVSVVVLRRLDTAFTVLWVGLVVAFGLYVRGRWRALKADRAEAELGGSRGG